MSLDIRVCKEYSLYSLQTLMSFSSSCNFDWTWLDLENFWKWSGLHLGNKVVWSWPWPLVCCPWIHWSQTSGDDVHKVEALFHRGSQRTRAVLPQPDMFRSLSLVCVADRPPRSTDGYKMKQQRNSESNCRYFRQHCAAFDRTHRKTVIESSVANVRVPLQ